MSRYTNPFCSVLLIMLFSLPFCVFAEVFVMNQASANDINRISYVGEYANGLRFEWKTNKIEIDEKDGRVTVDHQLFTDDNEPLGITGLVRLPWGRDAKLEITGGEIVSVSENGIGSTVNINDSDFDHEWAILGKAGILREITVAPLSINPVCKADDGSTWAIKNIQLNVEYEGQLSNSPELDSERPVSPEFYKLYKSLVINELDDLGLRLARRKGSLLIYTHRSNEPRINILLDWKRDKGFNVVMRVFDLPLNNEELRSEIREYYETLDPPLEYVLLIGDHNRGENQIIPAYTRVQNPLVPDELDVTDWPYAQIEGDDYFPEIFIGRMPVGNLSEAMRATSRIAYYESDPFLVNNESRWRRAVIIGANYGEAGYLMCTPVATSEWLFERLYQQWGLTESDTIFWRYENPEIGNITEKVNSGALFVNYRGWGNSTGWLQPFFVSSDVEQLGNYNMLPVVTSFVCNTGDFGDNYHTMCFATHWITSGTPNLPSGAVSVIAASDLHTKTKFNNPLNTGFYVGVYQDDLTNISAALLRSKFEIFNGHPNVLAENDLVNFYFNIYHVIGDPSLAMWTERPREMSVVHKTEISNSQNYLDIAVTSNGNPLEMAYVNVVQDDEIVDGCYTDASGQAYINLDNITTDDLKIHVTCDNYEPYNSTVTVRQEELAIGVVNWQVFPEGAIIPGNSYSLQVTLENIGTSVIYDIEGTLNFPDDEILEFSQNQANFGHLISGMQSTNITVPFEFTLNSMIDDAVELELYLAIESSNAGSWNSKIWIPINAVKLLYNDFSTGDEPFSPGHTTNMTLSFKNLGSTTAENLTAVLDCWDQSVTVDTDQAALETVDPGSIASTLTPFVLSINGTTSPGRVIRFAVSFMDGEEMVEQTTFSVPLQGVESSDPMGPDEYGYFVYDQTDVDWFGQQHAALTYNWPGLENNDFASYEQLMDDENYYLDLPFNFVFYGEEFTCLTVSSNGWIAFGQEAEYTCYLFRNWNIPSSIGPKNMIAAFWDDLKSREGEMINSYSYYDEENHKFIIEFDNQVNRYRHPIDYSPIEYAVVLYDPNEYLTPTGDGIIDIYYRQAENVDLTNNGATVGIQNEQHTTGLEYTYAFNYPDASAELGPESAIRFTTIPPDLFLPITEEAEELIPEQFKLYPAYPNPFNSSTELNFDIAKAGQVKLSVYNLLGQEIAVLIDRHMEPGQQKISFDVSNLSLSSGMLIYQLESAGEAKLGKMMYLK